MRGFIMIVILILLGAMFSNWIHKYLTFLPTM
jgi:uncharacterized membrane protein YwzB